MKEIIIAATAIAVCFAQEGKPKSELKNVTALPFTTKKEIVSYMKKVIAPELGVKCKFCHNMRDYSSDEKEPKLVAREMIRMVDGINKNTMKKLGHRDVSCWVCHRGQSTPELKK